jgi:hypothetical protein
MMISVFTPPTLVYRSEDIVPIKILSIEIKLCNTELVSSLSSWNKTELAVRASNGLAQTKLRSCVSDQNHDQN